MKILIGTPIHQVKDYAMERWLENVSKLKYPADLLLVDNSPNLSYMKKIKSYCAKYGIKKYKIIHIKVSQGMFEPERQERIAKAEEVIRQEVLLKNYDAWFSWESDIIIPVNALDKLVGLIEGGIMVVVHNSWMRRHPGFANFDMGCTLINREALEKYEFFPKDGFDFWKGKDDLYKIRVLKGGGNFVEVYGLISPIYHFDDESRFIKRPDIIKKEDRANLSKIPSIDIPHELKEMLADYQIHGEEKYTSGNWITLNQIHIDKLLNDGYDKFKHTIAGHYFTWLLEPITPFLNFLIDNLSKEETSHLKKVAQTLPPPLYASKEFDLTTLLLWQYVKRQGLKKELSSLSEPLEGSPPAINFEGRLISQDIANSVLEWDTVQKHIIQGSVKTILEIGAGYGRSAYVWLHLSNVQKYIIVDIPPSLYISQRYLSSQFPSKKVFKYRDFKSFDEVKDAYNQADIVFLMPWQMDMLPKKSIDLIYAVDSLSEMNSGLIAFYFKLINELCRGYFYMRYCKVNEIGIIKQGNYPIPQEWKSILVDSQCKAQVEHLESLYKLL